MSHNLVTQNGLVLKPLTSSPGYCYILTKYCIASLLLLFLFGCSFPGFDTTVWTASIWIQIFALKSKHQIKVAWPRRRGRMTVAHHHTASVSTRMRHCRNRARETDKKKKKQEKTQRSWKEEQVVNMFWLSVNCWSANVLAEREMKGNEGKKWTGRMAESASTEEKRVQLSESFLYCPCGTLTMQIKNEWIHVFV